MSEREVSVRDSLLLLLPAKTQRLPCNVRDGAEIPARVRDKVAQGILGWPSNCLRGHGCHDAHPYLLIGDARKKIESWRRDYNHFRPRSSISNTASAQFRGECTREETQ
jgi:transposase InsO family protein